MVVPTFASPSSSLLIISSLRTLPSILIFLALVWSTAKATPFSSSLPKCGVFFVNGPAWAIFTTTVGSAGAAGFAGSTLGSSLPQPTRLAASIAANTSLYEFFMDSSKVDFEISGERCSVNALPPPVFVIQSKCWTQTTFKEEAVWDKSVGSLRSPLNAAARHYSLALC